MESGEKLRQVWSGGSYSEMETVYLSLAGNLVESAGIDPDDGVLDVACGRVTSPSPPPVAVPR